MFLGESEPPGPGGRAGALTAAGGRFCSEELLPRQHSAGTLTLSPVQRNERGECRQLSVFFPPYSSNTLPPYSSNTFPPYFGQLENQDLRKVSKLPVFVLFLICFCFSSFLF